MRLRFSPHPWGWTGGRGEPAGDVDVFPTPVGMDRAQHLPLNWFRSFPHTRGDGPHTHGVSTSVSGFSPHPWGWTCTARGTERYPLVFPTPVGMDRNVVASP